MSKEVLTLELLRKEYKEKILASARENDIENIRVFGSVARGEATENSDVDLLISCIPGGDPWGLGGFYSDMQELFGSRVDVVTDKGISPYIKDKVLKDARPL